MSEQEKIIKYQMRLFADDLIALIGKGDVADVKETKEHLEKGTIFDFLKKNFYPTLIKSRQIIKEKEFDEKMYAQLLSEKINEFSAGFSYSINNGLLIVLSCVLNVLCSD